MNANDSHSSIAPSRMLGPYVLLREIGHGGMSTVYEARDTRLERAVALKVLDLPPQMIEDRTDVIVQMQQEARSIARLSHPNVVTIYDVGEQDGQYYLVTEYLQGHTLQRWLERGRFSFGEVAEILSQVAEGLDAVHAQGMLHGDIKCSNIMRLFDGRVKLLDFGIARFIHEAPTLPGEGILGTPAYIAPEVITGGSATAASDIWALGILLYEMLAGKTPFSGESVSGIVYRIVHATPDPLPDLPPGIALVLEQALEKDPDRRFASGYELSQAFWSAVDSLPSTTIDAPLALTAPPATVPTNPASLQMARPRRSAARSIRSLVVSPVRIVGTFAVVGSLFAGAYLLSSRRSASPVVAVAEVKQPESPSHPLPEIGEGRSAGAPPVASQPASKNTPSGAKPPASSISPSRHKPTVKAPHRPTAAPTAAPHRENVVRRAVRQRPVGEQVRPSEASSQRAGHPRPQIDPGYRNEDVDRVLDRIGK